MAVLTMLPPWALCGLALVAGRAAGTPAQANVLPPEPGPAGEIAQAEPQVQEPEPSYPIFDPEARLIGGAERHLEHPRAARIGEHNRQLVRPLGKVGQRSQVKRETYFLLLTAEL